MNEKKETFSDIIKGEKPVLVDFTAEWCGPCKMMKPVLEDLRQKMGDKIRILKLDIDKNPLVASSFHVQSVPTLILFRSGQSLWRQSGVVPASYLQQIISNFSETKTADAEK